MKPTKKNHYRTIVLSDIHLGTTSAKAEEVVLFLKSCTCDTLILNGDIIDGWQLKSFGKWEITHTRFFRKVLKMAIKDNTNIYYLRGNHDDFLDKILPLAIDRIKIRRELIYEGLNGKMYFIIHGDVFDAITTRFKWISKLGDIGYTFLLWLNKQYNKYRTKKGLPYYSLSQVIKNKVKSAVSYISDFEEMLANLAQTKGFDGVICGHIHHASIKEIHSIDYMNSGDWVESLTALVELPSGEWKIIYYNDMRLDKHTDTDDMDELEDLIIHKQNEIKIIHSNSIFYK
jgi:UDP-2,3-diacylglucosamine pyrophosphatase LpxH